MSQIRWGPHINNVVIQWTVLTTNCTVPVAAHDNGVVAHCHEAALKRVEKFRMYIVWAIDCTKNNGLTVEGDLLHQEVVQIVLLFSQY